MSAKPNISIIVNCYNGDKFLKIALDSIYKQTYVDWEIIFFDNASTDDSSCIAKSYDQKLKYIKNENLVPLGEARRLAIQHARGVWICFLDVDDIWYENKLMFQMKELENTNYIFSYSGVKEVDENRRKIRDFRPKNSSGNIFNKLLTQFDVNMVTPIYKREVSDRYSIYFDGNITASEEYNFFMRLAAKGPVLVQKEILGEYRVGGGTLTNRQMKFWAEERRYTLQQLKKENNHIEIKFKNEFEDAYSRADYYEARYLMSAGQKKEALEIMGRIKNKSYKYFILYFICRSYRLWDLIHSNIIKRRLSKLLR